MLGISDVDCKPLFLVLWYIQVDPVIDPMSFIFQDWAIFSMYIWRLFFSCNIWRFLFATSDVLFFHTHITAIETTQCSPLGLLTKGYGDRSWKLGEIVCGLLELIKKKFFFKIFKFKTMGNVGTLLECGI